jgi:tetratricopeptide (TPR) repeat protein
LTVVIACSFLSPHPLFGETGKLVVQVKDVQDHAVRGIEIGVEGIGGSGVTGKDGKAVLVLGNGTRAGDWVSLSVQQSPAGSDCVMVSPWDGRSMVPSFADKAENFVKIVVVQRKDRTALVSGTVLTSLVQKINKEAAPRSKDHAAEDPKAALNAVAKQYGFDPEELDKQIRAWGAKTLDPYEAGLAALYERNFPEASTQLQASLKVREAKLATDQKAVEADQRSVADAAFFLGSSLFKEGKYRESAAAYRDRLKLTPDEPMVMSSLAMSLAEAEDYAGAETLYRRALAIDEKALGPDHPDVARDLNNLAALLEDKGDYAGAEPLLRRALAIDEKALTPDHPEIARDLSNLAALLRDKGDYAGAEPLMRRALAIDEKALGPDHPTVAIMLTNLAGLLKAKEDYAGAEPLMRRALAIEEKALGPDHPTVAIMLTNLAGLLKAKEDYAGAEPLLRRALTIDEKALGPDDPITRLIRASLDKMMEAAAKTK